MEDAVARLVRPTGEAGGVVSDSKPRQPKNNADISGDVPSQPSEGSMERKKPRQARNDADVSADAEVSRPGEF